MALTVLAVLSGALQALGYFFYIRHALKNGKVPNPLSWAMFAYGTILLFFLEMDQGAGWELLVLPAICAVSSLFVVRLCWRRGGFKNPIDLTDGIAFGLDVLLTVCYMAAWVLMSRGAITQEQRETASLVILVCWNIGIFTAFTPIARETHSHPDHEHPLPWAVWTTAYVTLAVVTVAENGFSKGELLLYPAFCVLVHSYMAWTVWRGTGWRQTRRPS